VREPPPAWPTMPRRPALVWEGCRGGAWVSFLLGFPSLGMSLSWGFLLFMAFGLGCTGLAGTCSWGSSVEVRSPAGSPSGGMVLGFSLLPVGPNAGGEPRPKAEARNERKL
jgi:hypothetical protein